MDMVGAALGVVVLDEETGSLHSIIMWLALFDAACPQKRQVVDIVACSFEPFPIGNIVVYPIDVHLEKLSQVVAL